MKKIFWSSILGFAWAFSPLRAGGVAESDVVQIAAEKPRFNDQISLTPSKIQLEKPSQDTELRETLARLPILTSSSHSGLGSATSVTTSTGIASASTAVSIDGVPIVDPVGVGFDFSLLPNALVSGVEYWLPHHQALEPGTQTLASTSGRINVRMKNAGHNKPGASANVMLGSANSVLGSAAYQDGRVAAAATGFNTRGDFEYRNDRNGSRERRANNSAAGGGALASWGAPTGKTGEARVFGLASMKTRTNPGALESPGRDQERDFFSILGASVKERELLDSSTGGHALLSGSLSKVAVVTSPGLFGSDHFETRTFGGFAQAGFEKRFEPATIDFSIDHHVDYVRADSGRQNRNITGFGVAAPVRVFKGLTLAPWARQEVSSRMPSAFDAILAASQSLFAQTTLTLSYGWLHAYPTITQVAGERSPFGEILPNDSLKLERSGVWTLALTQESDRLQFYSLLQHARVRNRIGFSTLPTGQSQYVNQADAFIASVSQDVQWSPLPLIGLRAGAAFSRSFDYAARRDLSFKPRVVGVGSGVLDVGEGLRLITNDRMGSPGRVFLTIEESFWGKRYVEATGVNALGPQPQTNLKLALERLGGIPTLALSFRVANAFEESGFDYPGFPIPGRSYWLNLSWDAI